MANTVNPTTGYKRLAYGSLATVVTTVAAATTISIFAAAATTGIYGLGFGVGLVTLTLAIGTFLTRSLVN